jgi:hypothetical protein
MKGGGDSWITSCFDDNSHKNDQRCRILNSYDKFGNMKYNDIHKTNGISKTLPFLGGAGAVRGRRRGYSDLGLRLELGSVSPVTVDDLNEVSGEQIDEST